MTIVLTDDLTLEQVVRVARGTQLRFKGRTTSDRITEDSGRLA